ncbi:MAG: DUF5658 family protein [Desulfobacteraceae bacterium]|nr:DUF5658 family protein [Desulfobacteraceae bacterium]
MMQKDRNELPFPDRRSGRDRRARPTSPFTKQSLFGVRRRFRRKEDSCRYFFVDWYDPHLLAILLVTLILSTGDAFLTLRLVAEKFEELNPVMDFFLGIGPVAFVLAKWALTVFGLTTLLVLKNHYLPGLRVKTATCLMVVPIFYIVLVIYEIVMVMKIG